MHELTLPFEISVMVYLFGSRLSDHGEGGAVELVTLNRDLLTSEKNHLAFSEGET